MASQRPCEIRFTVLGNILSIKQGDFKECILSSKKILKYFIFVRSLKNDLKRIIISILFVSNLCLTYLSVQDIVFQLQRFVSAMAKYHNDCHTVMKEAVVFPIEVDLSRGTFTYDTSNQFNDGEDEEEEEEVEEAPDRANEGQMGDLISTD